MSGVTGIKKSEDATKYNRIYMNDYYKKNPIKMRLSRNSNRLKKLQTIDPNDVIRYGFQLSHIVKISKLFRELTPEMQEIVKNELLELNFDNIDYKV
jgi:hypothetical protein